MSRLVVVSNRVALPDPEHPRSGGLVVGILAALETQGGIWFGCDGRVTDGEVHPPHIVKDGRITYATIDLKATDHDGYYNGFSNNILWPLFHYLLGYFDYEREQYEAYRRVNVAFAERLIPLLEPDDVIWVHDYHLIPLGAELRSRGVDNPIGFFLHVPFPNYDMLRALPGAEKLCEAMLDYDVVGFQTPNDLRSFRNSAAQSIGADISDPDLIKAKGRVVKSGHFPISVDVANIRRIAAQGGDAEKTERLRKSLGDRKLIIGVDRLDYSKGLPERFRSFERFLNNNPENQGNVVYMQIAQPTRTEVRGYDEIRRELEEALGHINGNYADFDWVPIRLLHSVYPQETLVGFLRLAQVGLVTPLRDGMNLVAKEYVAAQDDEDPGVLILSTMAGAAKELTEAVLVNPHDADSIAESLDRAVHMPLAERRERHQSMLETLRKNNIHSWTNRFLSQLQSKP